MKKIGEGSSRKHFSSYKRLPMVKVPTVLVSEAPRIVCSVSVKNADIRRQRECSKMFLA